MAAASPFTYVNAINRGRDVDGDFSGYVPYMVNRSFSQFIDTAILANEMNIRRDVPKEQQFAFLLNTIRPRNRFSKWAKYVPSEDLDAIVEIYGYSYEKAKQVIDLFTAEQLDNMKKMLSTR